ncbi:MAG: hypothetical protein ACI9QN_002247, partial [Arcticibacterium sp.]
RMLTALLLNDQNFGSLLNCLVSRTPSDAGVNVRVFSKIAIPIFP